MNNKKITDALDIITGEETNTIIIKHGRCKKRIRKIDLQIVTIPRKVSWVKNKVTKRRKRKDKRQRN